ncbi:MFS transporter [uncultured Jatrophihabitans sp.]|uniref:MFS transporter n=1 Tax=uncultured Jatrophihabitans sp. TaxID=1610747 RepID=UPI0035CBF68A
MSDVRSEPAIDHGFLRRLTLAASWGEGLDGFDLGIISVVLVSLTPDLGVGPVMAGLLGASSLIGIFAGGPIAGYLTDRYGRRIPFIADIIAFVVLNALQAIVSDAWQLLVIRIALGLAIGAEYSIGAALLAEVAPARGRGRRLCGLLVWWYTGYLAAVVVAYVLIDEVGLSWRWALALGVVPAVATLLTRIGMPESPRWLMGQGREKEARAIIDKYLGGDAYFEQEEYDEPRAEQGYRALLTREHLHRLVFVCVFWSCQVAPYFAIFTFAPTVFKSLNLSNPEIGTLVANAIAAVGAFVGMLTIERVGRRTQLIPPFWIMAGALAVVGLWTGAPGAITVAAFAVFSFFNAVNGNLTAVYPIEIFPTEVRSSAVGIGAATSRLGAAAGTFLLPIGIDHWGIAPCMLIGTGLCVIGGVVSQKMAPETTGKTLRRTSASAPVRTAAPATA